MSVTATRRRQARTKVPPGICSRCMCRIRWLVLERARWRFEPTPVDPRAHASPPAYPVWRGRAWPVAALLEYLTSHFDMTQGQAQLIVDNCPWLLLHTCRKDGDR